MWCADYVIYWLSHSPNILGIMEFLAPMLLLLVLCSAYAEANGEGLKMIRVGGLEIIYFSTNNYGVTIIGIVSLGWV